jgi:hypothetical protein
MLGSMTEVSPTATIDPLSRAGYSTVVTAKVRTRQLTNAELGGLLGVSASFASYMRDAKRFPSPRVQAAMVKNLGADWPALNAALVAGKNGRLEKWIGYVARLAEVRVEPASGAEPPAEGGMWVQRRDGTWLKVA